MPNKKFLLGTVLSTAVLFTACSSGGAGAAETVYKTVSKTVKTSAEATETISETTLESLAAETIVEASTADEIMDTSGVEYMKEALQAEWESSEYDRYAVSAVNLYTADLNGDGTKELFVNYSFGAAMNGLVYVYDVSDGIKKLYEISSRMWTGKNELYKDESGTVHLIRKEGYAGGIGENDTAYFDITYDSIKMPIYVKEYDWYDGGAHVVDYDLYKNCEFAPLDYINIFSGWRNFDSEKAEYIGRYDWDDVCNAMDKGEQNEISEIIQKEVYDGLTYVSDVEEIYENSGYDENYRIVWDFDELWQQAAPMLAEEYSK